MWEVIEEFYFYMIDGSRPSVVRYHEESRSWEYIHRTQGKRGYVTKRDAAKDYVRAVVKSKPKKHLKKVKGKTWDAIFPHFGLYGL